ncbi:C-C motif chemokine 14-like [Corapipo altera]|uniref:C-C motif chemokine 14-like n=1 Tax=Corapipo altera TaxID=415028 RepID=UPI000FD65545|nr:C-C motif chemokine 14-like [Corapipo altera]
MKTFTAALAVLFVAVLCYQVSSSPSESKLSSPRSSLLFLSAVQGLVMLGSSPFSAPAVGKERHALPWLLERRVAVVGAHCGSSTSSSGHLLSLNHFGPCCTEFITRPLPLRLVKSYEHTGSHCSQPAVIFTTLKDKLVCANPDEKWVQDMVTQLKHKEGSG